MSGGMRERMPQCAAWVDAQREAFGEDEIDNVIRRGLRGDCKPEERVFFSEAGVTLGQPWAPASSVSGAQMVIGEALQMPKKRGRP